MKYQVITKLYFSNETSLSDWYDDGNTVFATFNRVKDAVTIARVLNRLGNMASVRKIDDKEIQEDQGSSCDLE